MGRLGSIGDSCKEPERRSCFDLDMDTSAVGDSRSISVVTENAGLCGNGDISIMSPGAGEEEGKGGVVTTSKFETVRCFHNSFPWMGYIRQKGSHSYNTFICIEQICRKQRPSRSNQLRAKKKTTLEKNHNNDDNRPICTFDRCENSGTDRLPGL